MLQAVLLSAGCQRSPRCARNSKSVAAARALTTSGSITGADEQEGDTGDVGLRRHACCVVHDAWLRRLVVQAAMKQHMNSLLNIPPPPSIPDALSTAEGHRSDIEVFIVMLGLVEAC